MDMRKKILMLLTLFAGVVTATADTSNGIEAVTKVRVIGGKRTIDISAPQSCTLGTTLSDAISDSDDGCVKLYESETGAASVTCAALLPPQTISGNFIEVTVRMANNVTDKATFSLSSAALGGGNTYPYTLLLNGTNIGMSTLIADWDEHTYFEYDFNGSYLAENAVDMGTVVNGKKVLWRTMNLGAYKDADYGMYFNYGAHEGHYASEGFRFFQWSTCPFYVSGGEKESYSIAYSQTTVKLSKYVPIDKDRVWGGEDDTPDNLTELLPEDDAAHLMLGEGWRIPTRAEMQHLISNSTRTLYEGDNKYNGVNGMMLTSNTTGNSIFLPSAGWHGNGYVSDLGQGMRVMTSTLYADNPLRCHVLFLYNSSVTVSVETRYFGFSIRPVFEVDN